MILCILAGEGVSVAREVELFSPSCQCYKLNYVLLRTKTGWQTISQNYNLGQSPTQHNTRPASASNGDSAEVGMLKLELYLASCDSFLPTTMPCCD